MVTGGIPAIARPFAPLPRLSARRVAWALKANLDFTTGAGGKSYGLSINPVAGTPTGPKAKARQRMLSLTELKTIWQLLPDAADPRTAAALRMVIAMGGLRITEISGSKKEWYKDDWLLLPKTKNDREHHVPLTELAKTQHTIALACSNSKSEYLFPNVYDIRKPIDLTSLGKVARRLMSDFEVEPFQLKDLRRTFKTHLCRGTRDRRLAQSRPAFRRRAQALHLGGVQAPELRVAAKIDEFLGSAGIG